uniref:Uncharacterized protein n=1 Tax=Anguilla anguilla TaxID=7936 RepID=A0A0E9X8P6_ANGAN
MSSLHRFSAQTKMQAFSFVWCHIKFYVDYLQVKSPMKFTVEAFCLGPKWFCSGFFLLGADSDSFTWTLPGKVCRISCHLVN